MEAGISDRSKVGCSAMIKFDAFEGKLHEMERIQEFNPFNLIH